MLGPRNRAVENGYSATVAWNIFAARERPGHRVLQRVISNDVPLVVQLTKVRPLSWSVKTMWSSGHVIVASESEQPRHAIRPAMVVHMNREIFMLLLPSVLSRFGNGGAASGHNPTYCSPGNCLRPVQIVVEKPTLTLSIPSPSRLKCFASCPVTRRSLQVSSRLGAVAVGPGPAQCGTSDRAAYIVDIQSVKDQLAFRVQVNLGCEQSCYDSKHTFRCKSLFGRTAFYHRHPHG